MDSCAPLIMHETCRHLLLRITSSAGAGWAASDLTQTQRCLCRWAGHCATPRSTRCRQASCGAPRHQACPKCKCLACLHKAYLACSALDPTLALSGPPAVMKQTSCRVCCCDHAGICHIPLGSEEQLRLELSDMAAPKKATHPSSGTSGCTT